MTREIDHDERPRLRRSVGLVNVSQASKDQGLADF